MPLTWNCPMTFIMLLWGNHICFQRMKERLSIFHSRLYFSTGWRYNSHDEDGWWEQMHRYADASRLLNKHILLRKRSNRQFWYFGFWFPEFFWCVLPVSPCSAAVQPRSHICGGGSSCRLCTEGRVSPCFPPGTPHAWPSCLKNGKKKKRRSNRWSWCNDYQWKRQRTGKRSVSYVFMRDF